jgi:S1-C subfamily serine protease
VAEELAYAGPATGVIINDVKPSSNAASVGFQRGDVVVDLNGTKIDSTKRLADLTKQQASAWTLTIKRGDQTIRRQFRG